LKIIGYHLADDICVDSDGNSTKDNYLDFMLRYCDNSEIIRVFYNLDWAVSRLCYLLNVPEWQLKKFWTSNSLYWQGWSIFYIPHRYLGIKYGKHWGECNFSDMLQYDSSLNFEIDPFDAAIKAKQLGEDVYGAMTTIGLHPTTLSSPVSVYLKEILNDYDLPGHDDIPPEVRDIAYECLSGGWQENFQSGHFENAQDFDITSAYSYYTANLIDHRYGKWVKSDKFFSKAPMGYCRGLVRVTSKFSPIIYRNEKSQYTPTGEFDKTLTNKQIKHLYDNDLGQFKIKEAYYWWTDSELRYPFKEEVDNLFEWKARTKGMTREVVKRVMVGVWGLFTQTFKDKTDPDNTKLGRLFDTVSASQIETQTRTQVADFVISNHAENDLLAIAVDGCLLNKKIDIKETGDMGTWRLNTESPAFVVSSGVGALKNKPGKGTFSLNYDWLAAQIAANPDASEYTMKKVTPVTIGNALKNNKLDKLGELEVTERSVFIGIENKRFYKESPVKGSDLYKQYGSDPLDISTLNRTVLDSTSEIDMDLTNE